MAKNIWDPTSPPEESFPADNADQKPNKNITIVAYNILTLVGYTVICAIFAGGALLDALLIAVHVFGCLILSLTNRSWAWFLSSVLVLLIGFSTCAGILWRLM